jgi:hypothetical protein
MKGEVKKAKKTLEALNTVASALADHGHRWSKNERRLYGIARRWLISFCGEDSAA